MSRANQKLDRVEPGPQLDAAVATHVMGWKIDGGHWIDREDPLVCRKVGTTPPMFSLQMQWAWDVVERMEKLGFEWGMHYEGSRKDKTIGHLYVVNFGGGGIRELEKELMGVSDEAALAICRAALKTMKWKEDRDNGKKAD